MVNEIQIKVLVVKPDDPAEVMFITADLDTLSGLVGGYLEGVRGPHGWHAYINEEGKLHGLLPNLPATRLAVALGWPPVDVLVGNAVFLGDGAAGSESGVPDLVIGAAIQLGLLTP
jgi:hypothetical protein